MAGMAMAAPAFYAQCMCHMHTYIGQIAWLAAVTPSGPLWTRHIDLATRVPGLACQTDWHIQTDKLLNPACTCIHMVAE